MRRFDPCSSCFVLALAACTLNGKPLKPFAGDGGSGGAAPAPDSNNTASSTSEPGISVKEQKWRRESEQEANGLTDANVNAYQYRHKNLVTACGHDVKVSLAWKTYSLETWGESKASPGTMCSNDALDAITSLCGDKDYKAAAAKITTMTCFSKPCDKLPFSLPDSANSGPGTEYELTLGNTNLAVSTCNRSSIYGSYDARAWLTKHL